MFQDSSSTSDKGLLTIGLGFPLIPSNQIQRWEYVSLADLLLDNLELARHSAESQKSSQCLVKAVKKWELSEGWRGPLAWAVCFNTFVAVAARNHPTKVQELLAYKATLMVVALCFSYKGWLSYDKIFTEHVEKDLSTNWSILHPMFYSLTTQSQRVEVSTCPRCVAPDYYKLSVP